MLRISRQLPLLLLLCLLPLASAEKVYRTMAQAMADASL